MQDVHMKLIQNLTFIISPTYTQTSTIKLILKLLRRVSVLIHHLQGVY